MRARLLRATVTSVVLAAVPATHLPAQARSNEGVTAPELALVLEPEAMADGVPQSFTFVLTNRSGHDLRLPTPSFDCSNPTVSGSVWLSESWTPDQGTGLGKAGGACDSAGTGLPPPPIVQVARTWTLLHAGESMYIRADNATLHYETSQPGTYVFSARYLPPMLTKTELAQLAAAGVAVPQHEASSDSLRYRK